MRVIGRSGQVMDLPDGLARALLKDGTVKPAEDKLAAKQASEKPEKSAGDEPKPRRKTKPKTDE